MWRLDYPWLLALAPLAWVAWRLLPPYRPARAALRMPFFDQIATLTGRSPQRPDAAGGNGQLWLGLVVWLLLALALARPQCVEPPLTHSRPVRDVLLALDISQSMETADFRDAQGQPISRWSAVQAVVADFIAKRGDDRLGLIVFGTAAYPQAPLTLDHAALQLLLRHTAVGMAGPNTAIGDAIGLGIRMLDAVDEPDKVLILLTDGNDTGSAVPPQRAAALAARHHIRVHTIGMGDPQARGDDKVDFALLEHIAQSTGGRFFQASDRESLQQVYATLDQITPRQVETLSHQPKRDFFWVPVGLAVLLLALWHGVAALLAWRRDGRPAPAARAKEDGAWTST